jgi:hypothetical protein
MTWFTTNFYGFWKEDFEIISQDMNYAENKKHLEKELKKI